MALSSLISQLKKHIPKSSNQYGSVYEGIADVIKVQWHLGFTAFGGPPVHFQIFHKLLVEKHQWIDEQMWQELFAISQALPGPGSTKMLFCINSIHYGFMVGTFSFFLWSLPGAVGMYALSLGIQRITSALPDPVYALLSGLNAATVGIVALAAVQLSQKAITDKLTRILVAFGGIAGMLYTALWYFPVLMATGGVVTLVWDLRLPNRIIQGISRRFGRNQGQQLTSITTNTDIELNSEGPIERTSQAEREGPRIVPQSHDITLMSLGTGWLLLASFTLSFIALMVARGVFRYKAIIYNVFANLYLAGTIIFGGGPVVIPLLREYVVNEGWVSPRDFLLGLALIQAFPGPNFNFAVYLGALSIYNQTNLPSVLGAVLGFVAIFLPGIWVQTAFLAFWRILRGKRWFRCLLRGLHATAVGLVYTAVYRLWQIGLLSKDSQAGSPLANDPWWVAVSVTSFVGGMWFDLSPPLAILLGGVMGLVWYGIVKA